jgi:hypothetical protein
LASTGAGAPVIRSRAFWFLGKAMVCRCSHGPSLVSRVLNRPRSLAQVPHDAATEQTMKEYSSNTIRHTCGTSSHVNGSWRTDALARLWVNELGGYQGVLPAANPTSSIKSKTTEEVREVTGVLELIVEPWIKRKANALGAVNHAQVNQCLDFQRADRDIDPVSPIRGGRPHGIRHGRRAPLEIIGKVERRLQFRRENQAIFRLRSKTVDDFFSFIIR